MRSSHTSQRGDGVLATVIAIVALAIILYVAWHIFTALFWFLVIATALVVSWRLLRSANTNSSSTR